MLTNGNRLKPISGHGFENDASAYCRGPMFMAQWITEEQESSWFHVMTRGTGDEKIFLEKRDYRTFLDVLAETCKAWDADIAAYCLLPDRYHLLIRVSEHDLSKCISRINGAYRGIFNRVHHARTRLFQRRYRSILVEEGGVLPDLMRYIHRIPVIEGMADKLEAYEWSSHRAYLSRARKWNWLHKETILSLLTRDKGQQRKRYMQLVV